MWIGTAHTLDLLKTGNGCCCSQYFRVMSGKYEQYLIDEDILNTHIIGSI